MDKKNTAIGVGLIAAALGLLLYNGSQQPKVAPRPTPAPSAVVGTPATPTTPTPAPAAAPSTPATPRAPEKLVTLENDTLRVTLTTHGGAIRSVALKKHASALDKKPQESPVVFNEKGPSPALALSFPDPVTGKPVAWDASFAIKEQSATRVVFEAARADGLVVTREFAFAPDKGDKKADPHRIAHKTSFTRTGGAAAPVVSGLNLGTLLPVVSDPANQFLNVSLYDGDNYEIVGVDKFKDSSGFLGFGAHKALPDLALPRTEKPLRWVASSNQFFAGIATFDAPTRELSTGLFAHPVVIGKEADGHDKLTLTAEAGINLGNLAPGETKAVALDYFVGPKEYTRLSELGDGQDRVVQFTKLFGFMSINWLCKLLMASLNGLHWITSSFGGEWAWGLAIVSLTGLIKGLTWPLTGMQMKAAENMKKLQKPMEALKEKYKDNPQKMQQETMKLYAEHKVNPFAGCLPILIQIPIFFGLYVAFQTCAELRHQPFLWFPDLSVADTIHGLPPYIHIMPVLMGVTMLVNMRMTPMTNVDPNQKTLFYVMMGLFPVMCYTSPAGLTTYWTVNNLLTLLQTWLNKRKQAALAAASAPGTVEIIPPAKSKPGKAKK